VATGQFVPGLAFPDEDQLFWYGSGKILHHDGIRRRCWKVPSGELLEDKPFVNRPPDFQTEQVSEDGKQVWRISRLMDRGGRAAVEVLDAATVQPVRKGEIGKPHYGSHLVGLVPGGKYFHRDCEIYDRETFKLVSQRQFPEIEMPGGEAVFALAFNPDGSRYAVMTGSSPDYDRDSMDRSPPIPTILRVIETAAGKTLYAVPVPIRRSTAVEFSPDGRRLAVADDDGTIEIWDLPWRPIDGST
jgi:WD40 repeat protein